MTHPPLIAIEIVSPEDSLRRAGKKAAKYSAFGLEHEWVIDPHARAAYRGAASGPSLVHGGELAVAATPIVLRIGDLFDTLDRIRSISSKQ